jgi:NTP pyrophosphatase (non-canonical NTP hydrolase)
MERKRQNDKWGEQNHGLTVWSAILTEECGEFAEAALGVLFQDGETPQRAASLAKARTEAIHCAAVALAIVECIDRHAPPS